MPLSAEQNRKNNSHAGNNGCRNSGGVNKKNLDNNQMLITFTKSLIIKHNKMDNKEIERLIEEEKEQLALFLKAAKKFGISDTEIEKQINFYLDRINELKNKIKKS